MASTFFRVLDEVYFPNRWHLGDPSDLNGRYIDPRLFTAGTRTGMRGPLRVTVDIAGTPLHFTFAAFDMPVAARGIVDILEQFSEGGIERIPVEVESSGAEYEICNVLTVIHCLDESRSEILYWTESDGRPDKVGRYRQVTNMRIDSSRAKGAHLFRLGGWKIALIVSEDVKDILERTGVTGITFQQV